MVRIEDIQRVLIVGAGTRGFEVSLQCARYGYKVVLYDIIPGVLQATIARQKAFLSSLVDEGLLTSAQVEATLNRITITTEAGEAAEKADLLNESIPENLELKARVLAQFNRLCLPHTIFTTNTPTLLPSLLAATTGRPAQFAVFHFHHYQVLGAKVANIVPHLSTSDETVELLYAFAKRIGHIPVISQTNHKSFL